MWIFGYGSLLWYTDFPYRKVVPGVVRGYSRRFWQLSPDHRGTPSNPGRTVTLVADENASCWGLAYEVAEEHVSDTIRYLNVREKAGYLRKEVEFHPDDGSASFPLYVYLAAPGQNPYYTGPVDEETIVQTGFGEMLILRIFKNARVQTISMHRHDGDLSSKLFKILKSRGPSGTNIEYALRLAQCVHRLAPHVNDEHLFGIEKKILERCRQFNIQDDFLAGCDTK